MKKIKLFEDFMEDDLDLSDMEKNQIREWMKKYEKYFNFHDTGSFLSSIDNIIKDCISQLGFDGGKKEAIQDYIQSLHDLSDGLSVVMAPGPEFQYTGIDQVSRFHY
jgi:hypothetical protein